MSKERSSQLKNLLSITKNEFRYLFTSTRGKVVLIVVGFILLAFVPDRHALQNFYPTDRDVSGRYRYDNINREAIRDNFNRYSMKELAHLYERWTMCTLDQRSFTINAIRRVNEEGIEGDVVELGVWKGGMTMGMMFQNQRHNVHRDFWLFDTFEGLPPPESTKDGVKAQQTFEDVSTGKETADTKKWKRIHTLEDGKWNWGPLDVVKNNVLYTGYPPEKIHFVKGKVEDTLPATTLPEKIAVLRLDTDWYDSTKIEMEYLFHRLQPGGVLIVDDYCHWEGSNQAVKEYFSEKLSLDADAIKDANGNPCFFYWKP